MFKLAGDSIVSSSVSPLKIPLKLGLFFFFTSILGLVVDLILYLVKINVNNFMTSFNFSTLTIILVIFFSLSIILLMLGIMCEYLARMMIESQNRPMYIIEEELK